MLTEPLTTTVTIPATEAQVIYVPEHKVLNVQAGASIVGSPFDGRKGGVVAVLATTIANGGTISANGIGYRGGITEGPAAAEGCEALDAASGAGGPAGGGAHKGEGIGENFSTALNTNSKAYGRGAHHNGGGGGNCAEAGGGGGGGHGRGGRGGVTLASDSGGRLQGGQGGGLTIGAVEDVEHLPATEITGVGRIEANGSGGQGSATDGDGGGGGGGSIFVQVGRMSCSGLTANGGAGASLNGGGGGGGGVRLEVAIASGCAPSVVGGVGGSDVNAQAGSVGVAAGAVLAFAVCGDGVVQTGESCDDGNRINNDGCSSECRVQTCTAVTRAGNASLFQVCTANDTWATAARTCASRTGWSLATIASAGELFELRALANTRTITDFSINGSDQTNEQTFRRANQLDNTLVTFLPFATGQNTGAGREARDCLSSGVGGYFDIDCDSGGRAYACEATCNDGVLAAEEACDDGNGTDADACTTTCLRTTNQICTANAQCATGVCDLLGGGRCEPANVCGNGRVEGNEKCDDGNVTAAGGAAATLGFQVIGDECEALAKCAIGGVHNVECLRHGRAIVDRIEINHR